MRFLRFPALCAAALLLGGCAGYHLGPVNDEVAGDRSVEILPFNNRTLQPRLGDAVTEALRERFQADATFHLATSGPGDVVVTGVITRYTRQGLTYLSSDVLTANNYKVEIVAHVKAVDRNGKVLLDKDVKGDTLVHVGSDLADAERQAMPLLADDLAQNVTQLLTEGTW